MCVDRTARKLAGRRCIFKCSHRALHSCCCCRSAEQVPGDSSRRGISQWRDRCGDAPDWVEEAGARMSRGDARLHARLPEQYCELCVSLILPHSSSTLLARLLDLFSVKPRRDLRTSKLQEQEQQQQQQIKARKGGKNAHLSLWHRPDWNGSSPDFSRYRHCGNGCVFYHAQ